ncbi:hypothetical protein CAC42_2261 [Sphaceloma murrayae]|uniref:Uncharacterized protein n=1 Tax=Sphaceloma murrayae TaxID=2082308 RepID=A0A2K1QJF9_9PEZI|nr:hypothetical protein CAC42_2261 [Sphaceloma murrayae]
MTPISTTNPRYTTVTMPPSPPSSISPREVHFAGAPTTINTGRRIMNDHERASVDHFETHARTCHKCQNAYERFKKGKHMCTMGRQYANDTVYHLFRYHGEIFSVRSYREGRGYVCVDMPANYHHIDAALKLVEKHGAKALFGGDIASTRKEKDKKKDKHHRHDSHGSATSYTSRDDAYAAANTFYPAAQHSNHTVSPPSSRTSSTDSRRPRSSELNREYQLRSDSLAATIGSRIPVAGTYETVTMRPATHNTCHRRS